MADKYVKLDDIIDTLEHEWGYEGMREDLEKLPTAEVEEVKHGEWATDKEDIYWGNSLKRKHCSACESRPYFDKEEREFVLSDYCPNCGAKMDGGKTE